MGHQEDRMAGTDNRFTIVVGIDFSDAGDLAFDHALELANARENADVHVVYVEDELTTPRIPAAASGESSDTDEILTRVQKRATERLDVFVTRAQPRMKHIIAHVRRGGAAEHIVQLASHLDADLIVVGTHGRRGLQRFLLGSVAERVLRLARCPVFVVRPKDHEGLGKVPEIEPPCPDCLKARRDSGGAKLWCARHSEHHIRPHTYHHVHRDLSGGHPMGVHMESEGTPDRVARGTDE
jgi:nucleotide-binding universal stress UspA family protein